MRENHFMGIPMTRLTPIEQSAAYTAAGFGGTSTTDPWQILRPVIEREYKVINKHNGKQIQKHNG